MKGYSLRGMTLVLVVGMSAALPANRVAAQYAMEQGRSLKDAQTINVVLGPGLVDDADLYQRVTLELRKVGIAIANEGHDVILNLSLETTPNTITQDVRFHGRGAAGGGGRTGEELQLVTWYYEYQQRINNASWNRETLTRATTHVRPALRSRRGTLCGCP